MIKEFKRILKQHSDEVFGVRAKTTLSIYTVLAIACVVVPTVFFIALTVSKLF